jgi:putative hydrolase of the HAD superfamily
VSAAGVRAVLLDGLGTLIALAPPAPALAGLLQHEHAIDVTPAQAERAFAAEMSYYREHHHEARDASALADLRARCARVLASELPAEVEQRLGREGVTALLLDSLHFSAQLDARPALERLRADEIRLVAVSNWDCGLPSVLRRTGLERYLDGAVSSGQVGAPKPAPEIFRAALELAGVAPGEALHVGDSVQNDVHGARAVGIAAVLLRRPSAAHAALAEPPSGVPVIGSLGDLPTVISARAVRLA